MENTNQKIISNIIWRFSERSSTQLVQLIVSIILARLLTPEIFGTVSLITVFIAIFQVFVDSGLGNALIQKKDSDDLDFSTVFYSNIFFSIIIYLIIFSISPLIASFYNNTSLIVLIRVLSISILVSGIKNIQQAYISKNLMFKKFFQSTLLGTIISGIIGILLALKGFEVWALIIQQLTNIFIDTIILWISVKWKPKLQFSFKRFKSLFSYGWKLLASALLDTFYNNIRQLIIGKNYSSKDLAFYNKGRQFPSLIINNINISIDSVLFPSMSNIQNNNKELKNMTKKAIKINVFIIAPLMLILAFCSSNLVTLLLTEKWLPIVPYIHIFCITYMFYPIHTVNLNVLKALGRSDIFLKLEIIKKIIGIVLLIVTMNISVLAMTYSLLISSLLSQIINSWPSKKLLDYSYIEQLKDIFPSTILAILMGFIINIFNLINIDIFIKLILQVVVGLTIYLLSAKILKIKEFDYICDIIKFFLKRD